LPLRKEKAPTPVIENKILTELALLLLGGGKKRATLRRGGKEEISLF